MSLDLNTGCVKQEPEFIFNEHVQVKEEQVDVKEEADWSDSETASLCGISEAGARAGLYTDHVVKDELVLGPEQVQPANIVCLTTRARSALCGNIINPRPRSVRARGYQKHRYSGPRSSRKKVAAGIKRFHGIGKTRTDIWRKTHLEERIEIKVESVPETVVPTDSRRADIWRKPYLEERIELKVKSVPESVVPTFSRPGWSMNPFWEDEVQLSDASRTLDDSSSSVQPQPSTSKKSTEKKPAKKRAPKKPKAPTTSSAKEPSPLDSYSESEDEQIPCAQAPPVKRKRPAQILESEDEAQQDKLQKPVRAAALRSFLTQRGASGFTTQRDPTKTGEYFIELRVYNSREAERLPAEERWKNALTTLKVAADVNTPLWTAVSKLVQAGRQEFIKIQPIMYPSP